MKPKKNTIIIGIVLLLLILGLISNPDKDNYTAWFKEKAVSQGENTLEKGFISLVASPFVSMNTTSKNLIFFSIYETSFNDTETIKVIGAFNNFFPIGTSSSK